MPSAVSRFGKKFRRFFNSPARRSRLLRIEERIRYLERIQRATKSEKTRIALGKRIKQEKRAKKSVEDFMGRLITGVHGALTSYHGGRPTVRQLLKDGTSPIGILEMGYSRDELLAGGVTLRQLAAADSFSTAHQKGSFSTETFRAQGFTPVELYNYGYSARVVQSAGFNLEEIIRDFQKNKIPSNELAEYLEKSGLIKTAMKLYQKHHRDTRWQRYWRNVVDFMNAP